jgi:hypothetical protein
MAGQGFCGGGGCLLSSRPLPEQVPPAPPAAAQAGMAVARRAPFSCARAVYARAVSRWSIRSSRSWLWGARSLPGL